MPSAAPAPAPRSVSILIAAHNRCELLARTLESLRGLEIAPDLAGSVECLVIANACTDDTEGVVTRAAPTMPFPTRVVAEPRQGVSFARNRAVEESRHELCLFIDSDCLAEPGWLAEHVRMYREHGADLVTGRIDLWWAECDPPPAGRLSRSMLEALGEHHFAGEDVRLDEPRAYAANFSFRREVFGVAGPFRTDIGRSGLKGRLAHEETVFARRAMARGAMFWYAPGAIVRHHVPASSLSDEFFCRSAYWGSVSTMLTMEPLGAGQAARTLIKSPLRAAISQAGLFAARLRGDEFAASQARMDRAGAAGRLHGLWKRVAG
jgi:glycosyltransferase involved in cell wall biosynthesis